MASDSLHFGIVLPNYGDGLSRDALTEATVAAERSGFDSVWATDHVMVTSVHAPVYGHITEALVTLGYLAALTDRVSLGVSALIVPQRNPFVVLKQLTSLDYLSGGRIVTSVAGGWMADEFVALGADFESRGRMLDEWLDTARAAFDQMPGKVIHDGAIPIEDGWLAPALERPGGPELWVAGVSKATLRRAAKTGVWHPTGVTAQQLAPLAGEFHELCPGGKIVNRIAVRVTDGSDGAEVDERGRPALIGPPGYVVEQLRAYAHAGCDGFVVNLDREVPGLAERVAKFADEVISRFA